MAISVDNGILALITPAADTLTNLFTAGSDKLISGSLTICNRGSTVTKIRVAVDKGGTVKYLRYDIPLAPAGNEGSYLDLRAILFSDGEKMQVYADEGSVDFVLSGYEAPANFVALD